MKAAVTELSALLSPDRVLHGEAVERAYDCDAYTVDKSQPQIVVLPESTAEVQKIIKWCRANQVPYTPRGAGTGLSGGALAAKGGVIISTKKMTKILEYSPTERLMRAQAGAVNVKLSQAAAQDGLHFAPDPSSQSVSTLGGNIAENSGGPHTLKYGVTAQHILGMTVVDHEGEVLEFKALKKDLPGLDLTTLLVGSEGTLGFVTEAVINLTPNPASVQTALAAFPTLRSATESVAAIIAAGVIPAALELMDAFILEAVSVAFGFPVPAGTAAMLLIECDGSPESAQKEIEEAVAICQAKGAFEVTLAKNPEERAKLWTARKKGVGALGRLAPTIVTHDGVIPRSQLPDMLEYADQVAKDAGVRIGNIFHAGDGNLHPIFCFDERVPGSIDKVVEAGEKILRRCVELGGSITGEHGVGVEKLDMIQLMFDEDDLHLQNLARSIFHEDGLVNPCKMIPNQKGCTEHRRRWRGVAT